MIISRAPLRITLGGGGTDLPSYYKRKDGFLISGAINKYVFVGANRQFYNTVSLKYRQIEEVDDLENIRHPLFRESLKLIGIRTGIEITSLADIPSRTGLGASGAFLIALLNTLHHYQGNDVSKRQIAEEACKIEIDILKEHEGKQDKYACAFGGLKAFLFKKNGDVSVIPLINEDIVKKELEKKLFLFYTGERRKNKTSNELAKHDNRMRKQEPKTMERMDKILKIGRLTFKAFENGDFDAFGEFLDEHWKIKKEYSPQSTNPQIDNWYNSAIESGCLGGKSMGSGGGGGFLMFYHPGSATSKWQFVEKMKKMGLTEMKFKFDDFGVSVVSKEDMV